MRALVVDDNEDMRQLVKLLLDLAGGIEVIEADDACPAAKAWTDERPDVVILDFQLPTHDGLAIAQWMIDQDPTTPIVLFSAYLDEQTLARAGEIGVRACVSKDRVSDLPELALTLAAAA